jgi:hypothetical protein
MLYVVFPTSRFVEKKSNRILGDEPLLSQEGSVTPRPFHINWVLWLDLHRRCCLALLSSLRVISPIKSIRASNSLSSLWEVLWRNLSCHPILENSSTTVTLICWTCEKGPGIELITTCSQSSYPTKMRCAGHLLLWPPSCLYKAELRSWGISGNWNKLKFYPQASYSCDKLSIESILPKNCHAMYEAYG